MRCNLSYCAVWRRCVSLTSSSLLSALLPPLLSFLLSLFSKILLILSLSLCLPLLSSSPPLIYPLSPLSSALFSSLPSLPSGQEILFQVRCQHCFSPEVVAVAGRTLGNFRLSRTIFASACVIFSPQNIFAHVSCLSAALYLSLCPSLFSSSSCSTESNLSLSALQACQRATHPAS